MDITVSFNQNGKYFVPDQQHLNDPDKHSRQAVYYFGVLRLFYFTGVESSNITSEKIQNNGRYFI